MTKRFFGILSDTHGYFNPQLFKHFDGVEAILHAGDVGDEHVLDDLETIAPVYAVRGNVDLPSSRLPAMQIQSLPFGVAVVTHSDLLPDRQRTPRGLARHFREHKPRVIVYGHTHLQYLDQHEGIWVVNSGPAGRPRFNDRQSVVRLSWD